MTEPEQSTKKPGPNIYLSLLIFLTGAVLISVGATMLLGATLGAITEDAFEIPGDHVRDLGAGNYDVYVSSGDFFAPFDDLAAGPADITITNVDTGTVLPFLQTNSDFVIERGRTTFALIGGFEVTEPGLYEISVSSDADGLGVVSRALPTSFREVQTPILLVGAGVVLVLIGAAMTIVGTVRRSRAKSRARTGTGPESGVGSPRIENAAPTAPPANQPPLSPPPPQSAPPNSANSATPWDE